MDTRPSSSSAARPGDRLTVALVDEIRAAANGYDAPDLVDEVLAAVQRRAAAAVKVCGSCAEPHPLLAFGGDASHADALATSCRVAEAARKRARRAAASVKTGPLL